MAPQNYISLLFLFSWMFLSGGRTERIQELIYSSIEGSAACFRRLNGTQQAGCSTADKGSVGVVHIVNEMSDIQWLIYQATSGPYMVVVSTSKFDFVELLIDHPENIAGVVTFENTSDSTSYFTHDSRCPNEYSAAPGSTCSSSKVGFSWNEKGTGLLQRDIPFPIFFLPESRKEEIEKIQSCYERFNLDRNNQNGRPLCSVQLNSFMYAAINTEVCLRRSAGSALLTSTKVCDPLGDYNIYYSLFPQSPEMKKKSVTLVTARLDASSLFDGISPGAASSVVGFVTLIAAASTLAQLIPAENSSSYDHNVIWTIFNGEAFDYIGSQRVAYDIKRGVWPPNAPITASDIQLHIEIGQIGGSLSSHSKDTTWPLYGFAPKDLNVSNMPEITEFLNALLENSSPYNRSVPVEFTDDLPPSSLHSFKRILNNVTELLLVDHEKAFTNMFYNSVVDDDDKIGFSYANISMVNNDTFISTAELIAKGLMNETAVQVKISRLATSLSYSLYKKVVGEKYAGNISASAHLVDEMLYCFLKSQKCKLLAASEYGNSEEGEVPSRAAPLYVGVSTWNTVAPVLAGHVLALLTGRTTPDNRTQCENKLDTPGYANLWLRGWNHSGVCIQTTMNFSQALSPAFLIPDYDLQSGEYSTWTESVWQAFWARVFVSASGAGATTAAVTGALATVTSAVLTFWLQRKANIIFANPPSSSIVVDDAASGILRSVNC